MMMRHGVLASFVSEEEYFLFEEKSETKHELINSRLYEMSSVSIFHNHIVLQLVVFFSSLLKEKYTITFGSFKFKTSNKNFLYPNFMICERNPSKYFTEKPILIAEVLSPSTRKYNLVDKFIQYQKAETLQYYLCIEPEKKVVIFYFKTNEGEWMTETFTSDEDEIQLPHLNINITVKDLYQAA